jgi:oxygen-dependent protoporphyrinogen oxidase
VLSVDWTCDLAIVRRNLPANVAVQGNLDPVLMNTTPEIVRREAGRLLESMRGTAGHIFNLGHGIMPQAKIECMQALVDTVTEWKDGWLVEGGPNSLQETPAVATLISDLGLSEQRALVSPAAKQRFIVRDGRPLPVPLTPGDLLTSPLFSVGARLRVLTELLTRPRVRTTDVNLAAFVASHFGREIVDYGLNPFVGGIYAGDPEKLSARYAFPSLWQLERSHGSLLRGFRAQAAQRRARGEASGVVPIISFRQGLQTLPLALAAALPAGTVQTDATVTSLIPGQPWKLIWTRADSVQTAEFDAVVLALPAAGLASLVFSTLGERSLASLDHIPQPPVSSLFLGFRREQVAHPLDGFGALVPAREQRSLLGVLFSSSLFADRAPDGHVALTVFAGGMRQPETGRLDTAALLARVLPDLPMATELKDTLLLPKTDFPMRANLVQREPGRVAHWDKLGLYHRIQQNRAIRPAFVLHDGPPFTNGDVHIGTALNKTLKDIVNRYKSMRGLPHALRPWLGLPRPAHRAEGFRAKSRRTSSLSPPRRCAREMRRIFRGLDQKAD